MIAPRALGAIVGASLVALSLLAAACGDDDDSSATPATEGSASVSATPADDPSGDETPDGSRTPRIEYPEECDLAATAVGLISKLELGAEGQVATGQPVEGTLAVINCGDNDATLHYSTSQRSFMVVSDEADQEIWRSDQDEVFEQATGQVVIEPGGLETYSATWDQTNTAGEQVPPGTYKATYFSLGCGQEGAGTDCRFADIDFLQILEATATE